MQRVSEMAVPTSCAMPEAVPHPARPAPGSLTEGVVAEADRLSPRDWDRLVTGFSDVSYDQTAVWSDGLWGEGRTSHIVVRKGADVLGCARVVLLAPPLIRTGLAYVKFGPLWRPLGAPADPERYRAVLDALVAEYCSRRGCLLTVLPRPDPSHNALEADVLRAHGFRNRRPLVDPCRHLVDLRLNLDEQMASLGQKWRYNLRKALKNGIEVEIRDDAAAISEFTAMHARMVARKRFLNVDSTDLLPDMLARLPEAIRPRIAIARKDGQAVAGAVVGETGDVAIYLFGASRDEALPLNAGYALQWRIIEWLSGRRARWYDLGGAAMDSRLDQFKSGLVGRRGETLVMPGEHDFWTHLPGRLIGDAIYAARAWHRRLRGVRAPANTA